MAKRALDKRLCSVELHAPSQLRGSSAFSLFAVLTFDIKSDKNKIEEHSYSIRYGFHAAELRLRLRKCKMAPAGRYVKLLKPRVIRTERQQDSGKAHKAAGRLGLGFAEIFGFVTPAGQVSSTRHSAVNASVIESGTIEIVCAVVQRHGDYWRVYGIENADGVLCGQVLGDEKLCDIDWLGSRCDVGVEVFADLADLWVQVDAPDQPAIVAEANRRAICSALVAKALRAQGERPDVENLRGPLLLATDHLSVEDSADTGSAPDASLGSSRDD